MSNTTLRNFLLFLGLMIAAAACTGGSSGGDQQAVTTTTSEAPPITAEPLPDIDPAPGTPTGLIVVRSGDGTIEIGWDVSRDDTVTGYEITRVSPSGNTERFEVGAPSFVDQGLEDGEIYTYQVKAISSGGTSDGSEPVTAKVGVDNNPPKTPSRPVLVESQAGVELSWSEVNDLSGIDSYIVTRTIGEETIELDAATTNSLFDDVEPGLIVTYSVRAVDGAGNESENSRKTTVLSGTAANGVVVVVSAEPTPESSAPTARLERDLLEAGYTITWFEDQLFDANVTTADDIVLLLGDVQGEGFDWNIFATDATVVGLKSMFVQASGLTENPPKLDRLAQLDYVGQGKTAREVALTNNGRPKPVVYIPPNEIIPSMETWARPVWSDDIAVAGLIPKDGELANEKPAPGCRAFFPGNSGSLAENTEPAWDLLIEFVGDIRTACTAA